MRRFSQRNSLVTLSDINITPLLDLAFVLLIIFVIISPSIAPSRESGLTLPKGGGPDKRIDPKNIRTVEAIPAGGYLLDSRPMSLEQIQSALRTEAQRNPNLIVYFRADGEERWKRGTAIIDFCQKENIQLSVRTQP